MTERKIVTWCSSCGKEIYDWKDLIAGVCEDCWRKRGIEMRTRQAEIKKKMEELGKIMEG